MKISQPARGALHGSPVKSSGFSLLEILVVVAAVGILAAIAFWSTSNTTEAVKQTKLDADVAAVNGAIKIYIANGGSLDGVTDPQAILNKLKTKLSDAAADKFNGFKNAMIDKRMSVEMLSAGEAGSSTPRAIWNSSESRFEVATSGANGVARFYMDESLAGTDYGTEVRENSSGELNANNGWIWVYNDQAAQDGSAPTAIPLPGSSAGGGGGGAGAGGGSDDDDDGDDEGGAGDDEEEEDRGRGDDDDGEDEGPDNRTPQDEDEEEEEEEAEEVEEEPAEPTQLDVPLFSIADSDHALNSFPLSVGLTNPNDARYSTLVYSYEGSDWAIYEGPISVSPNEYIAAMVLSLDTDRYLDSDDVTNFYRPVIERMSGQVDGRFRNPQGPSGMVQSITSLLTGTASKFQWGTSRYWSGGRYVDLGPPNELYFEGQSFSDVEMGQRIKVGDLNYFNGSVLTNSIAERVTLRIDLVLDEPAGIELTTDFVFNLENTTNTDNPYDSADYVRLSALTGATQQEVNGVRYNINIEFGRSTQQGFTSVSQFHVFEGEGATAELFATITPVDVELEDEITAPTEQQIADLVGRITEEDEEEDSDDGEEDNDGNSGSGRGDDDDNDGRGNGGRGNGNGNGGRGNGGRGGGNDDRDFWDNFWDWFF